MELSSAAPVSAQPTSRYLGIDPGLNRTGYAILDRTPNGPVLREGGVLRSSASNTLAERVHELGTGLSEIVTEFRPHAMGIEQLFSLGKNPKTALMMAHARGAYLFVARNSELPILHFTPSQVKKLLTGSGRASKEQIQYAVQRELGLPSVLEPNDVADAAAIALCLYHSVKFAV